MSENKYGGIHRVIPKRDYESVPVRSANALFEMFQDEDDSEDEAQYDVPDTPTEEKHEPQVCNMKILRVSSVHIPYIFRIIF